MARLIYGKSVKGASHVRSGMPCQDSFRIEEISPDLSIVAVADGHGSDNYPRTDKGARFAVDAAIRCICDFVDNADADQLIADQAVCH